MRTISLIEALAETLRPELQKHFKPAFLGRLKVIPYYPIIDENLRKIVRLKLNKVGKRLLENRNTRFTYGDDVVESIAGRCTEVDSGARNIDHIINGNLLPRVSTAILEEMAEGTLPDLLWLGLDEAGEFAFRFGRAPVAETEPEPAKKPRARKKKATEASLAD